MEVNMATDTRRWGFSASNRYARRNAEAEIANLEGIIGGRDELDMRSDLLATSSLRNPRNARPATSPTSQAGKAAHRAGEAWEAIWIANPFSNLAGA